MHDQNIEARLERLEHRLKRRNLLATSTFVLGVSIALIGTSIAKPKEQIIPEVKTYKLTVLDSMNRPRVQIAEDDSSTDRVSRAAGITIYDTAGHERGGFGTMADGSAVMALDAPHGVGSPMPDRAGIKVNPDGSSFISAISNSGNFAATLFAENDEGRLELTKLNSQSGEVSTRTITPYSDTLEVSKVQR